MRWLDVVWSAVAGACCTFAIVHGLVWWRRREAVLNGLFALIAVNVTDSAKITLFLALAMSAQGL